MSVTTAFERLLSVHGAAGSPFPDTLAAPVDASSREAVEDAIGGRLPAEVAELARLADGVDTPQWNQVAVVPPRITPDGPEFVSLAVAVETATAMRSAAAELPVYWEVPQDGLWKDAWRLAFPTSPDECVGVDCTERAGSLWVVRWQEGEPRPLPYGLEGLAAAAADRFEALRGRWDAEGGVLEYDYDMSDQLGPFP